MFMTYPEMEHPIPLSLLPPGAKVWRAVELSLRLPWFLAVVEDPVEEVFRDLLLSSEMDVAQLIEESPEAIKQLEVVSPEYADSRWSMRRVKSIWKIVEPSGFTQWIYGHDDGTKSYCPPCSEEFKQSFGSAKHVLDLE
ncbi:hypothetical protein JY96_11210 [Aquabacterium sp. NJ1]|uniref:hypothetical protein n=1 Tax=Aquabacterium sp. NJ1 TaxID=1538295 RepID=UPI00052C93F3|nr:hypothetical protein [Aquabacterium sp. NJ1]KGM40409.1 hypothetical protein JY96_11210 [Aquabacterium sp. NJ1]